tara:strand:+ start:1300 stop:1701 length:402 start_codon:yes stop_codon:yes gene_type:complete
MKDKFFFIKVIILMVIPLYSFSASAMVYEQVCERIAAWQSATGINVNPKVPGSYQRPKVTGSYKISMIGEPEFHQVFKLPMFDSNVKEKCEKAFLGKVQNMPERGMLEVIFRDALPQALFASTTIHLLFLEFP